MNIKRVKISLFLFICLVTFVFSETESSSNSQTTTTTTTTKRKRSQEEIIQELLSEVATELDPISYDEFQDNELYMIYHYHPAHSLSYTMAVLFRKEAKKYQESELVKKTLKEIMKKQSLQEQEKEQEQSTNNNNNNQKQERDQQEKFGLSDYDIEELKSWAGSVASTSLYYRKRTDSNGPITPPICKFGFINSEKNKKLSERMNVKRLPSLQLVRKGTSYVSELEQLKEDDISFLIERSAKGVVSVLANLYQWENFIKTKPISIMAIIKDLNSPESDVFERAVQDFSLNNVIQFGLSTQSEILKHYNLEWSVEDEEGEEGNQMNNNNNNNQTVQEVVQKLEPPTKEREEEDNKKMGPSSGPIPKVLGTKNVVLLLHSGPYSKPKYFCGNFTTSSINLWIQKFADFSVGFVNGDNWNKWVLGAPPLLLLIDEFKDSSEIGYYQNVLYKLASEFPESLRFAYSNLAQTPHLTDLYRFSGENTPVVTIINSQENKHYNYPEEEGVTVDKLRSWIESWIDGGVQGKLIELPDNVKNSYQKPTKLKYRRVN